MHHRLQRQPQVMSSSLIKISVLIEVDNGLPNERIAPYGVPRHDVDDNKATVSDHRKMQRFVEYRIAVTNNDSSFAGGVASLLFSDLKYLNGLKNKFTIYANKEGAHSNTSRFVEETRKKIKQPFDMY